MPSVARLAPEAGRSAVPSRARRAQEAQQLLRQVRPDLTQRPADHLQSGIVGAMDQRISFVTLAVADLARTHTFYVDGLGWAPELYVPDEVLMIRAGEHLVLSLWAQAGFEAEVGPVRRGPGLAPLTLAHNVRTEAEVDEILDLAAAIGAAPVSRAQRRDWGGYTGYFADPDGFRWEIAVNPGLVGELVLPEEG